MDPKIKRGLFVATSILAAGQLTVSAVQNAFPPAHAQTQLPLVPSVTGNEILRDFGNATGGFFTAKQLEIYGNIIAGHMSVTGSVSTVTNCGSTPSIIGTDVAGRVTFGTGSVTTCTVNFASAYVSAPYCVLRHETGSPSTNSYLVSTTNFAITQGAVAGSIVDYFCIGQAGG